MFRARGLWSAALLCATMLAWPAPASPQCYPAWPIKLVVRFPAGGPSSRARRDKRKEFDGRNCFALDCIAPISRDAAK